MKKSQKRYLLYLAIGLIFSCNYDASKLQSVTVYKTPFGISHSFNQSEKDIKKIPPYHISDSNELRMIEKLISELSKAEEEEFINDIYMLVVFHYEGGRKVEMLYNRKQLKVGEKVYKIFPEFIEYLLIHQLPEEVPYPY